jgi:hypothetical protein
MAAKKDSGDKVCEVKGCSNKAERSVSVKKLSKAGLNIEGNRGNAHLCKDHYKEYKKATKEERKLERMGW